VQIGGGIRAYTDSSGRAWSALDVAARYFRAGADKVSIGSDGACACAWREQGACLMPLLPPACAAAVAMAEAYWRRGASGDGSTAIEQIARVYGSQAVVVSLDPRRPVVQGARTPPPRRSSTHTHARAPPCRVYVSDSDGSRAAAVAAGHHVLDTAFPGPAGQTQIWYQCTVKGGREGRPICAHRVAIAVEVRARAWGLLVGWGVDTLGAPLLAPAPPPAQALGAGRAPGQLHGPRRPEAGLRRGAHGEPARRACASHSSRPAAQARPRTSSPCSAARPARRRSRRASSTGEEGAPRGALLLPARPTPPLGGAGGRWASVT